MVAAGADGGGAFAPSTAGRLNPPAGQAPQCGWCAACSAGTPGAGIATPPDPAGAVEQSSIGNTMAPDRAYAASGDIAFSAAASSANQQAGRRRVMCDDTKRL